MSTQQDHYRRVALSLLAFGPMTTPEIVEIGILGRESRTGFVKARKIMLENLNVLEAEGKVVCIARHHQGVKTWALPCWEGRLQGITGFHLYIDGQNHCFSTFGTMALMLCYHHAHHRREIASHVFFEEQLIFIMRDSVAVSTPGSNPSGEAVMWREKSLSGVGCRSWMLS